MLKRLWRNFKKDWKRGVRHHYILITLATALIFVLFVRFVLPEQYSEPKVYQYISTDVINDFETEEGVTVVDSKQDVYDMMHEEVNSYGVIVENVDNEPKITIVTQSNSEGKFSNLTKLMLNMSLSNIDSNGNYEHDYEIEYLHPEMKDLKYRDNFLPILIVMDSAMIGMFLLSVMLFTEKELKMHTAYMVSPGGLTEHLLSKSFVMIALSLISAFTVTLLLRGLEANYLYLLLIMIPSAFLGSGIGLLLGSIFKNVQKSMVGLISIMVVLIVPIITYIYPAFNPVWIKLIPTYWMVYGVRAAVIPMYGFKIVLENALIILAYGILLFGISKVLYQKALYKNG